jgi:iron complex outermembrane receptor protein
VGNLAFEIGDENLERERSNGVDISLRHQTGRIRGEANFFYYDFGNFVYLAPGDEFVDGLIEAVYAQDDARFTGTEMKLDVGVSENLWVNLGLDAVDAQLTATGAPLPRIPPFSGSVGLDFRLAGLSVTPEVVMAAARDDVFATETPTAGYAVFNLAASYTVPQQHFSHHFSVNFFNMGDRLYRNHVSFIKDLAPEIGRGVRFGYAVKFF